MPGRIIFQNSYFSMGWSHLETCITENVMSDNRRQNMISEWFMAAKKCHCDFGLQGYWHHICNTLQFSALVYRTRVNSFFIFSLFHPLLLESILFSISWMKGMNSYVFLRTGAALSLSLCLVSVWYRDIYISDWLSDACSDPLILALSLEG